ncbi:MAG TPA: sulfatase [Planctomycetaceae bacterium]|nr:sulfatase [Planctomycetaceae bacterium]
MQNPQTHTAIARRTFLRRSGLGSAALASMLASDLSLGGEQRRDGESGLHVPARIKRVIHLCMAGGPSHIETLDHKPELAALDGKPMPESVTAGQPIAQLQGKELKVMGPQHPFSPRGQSGLLLSNVLEKIGDHADDLCVIKSMHTEQINHDPAHTFFNTGTAISGRPSMGSWVLYGLGAETEDLPGFIVLTSEGGGQSQPISSRQWHSGFLPSRFQGVQMHASGSPVHYVENPKGVTRNQQRQLIDTVSRLNELHNAHRHDPEVLTRLAGYEMAFRMQASVPELTDMSHETQRIIDMYGCVPGDGSFASNCLLARRLAERGVRFIQLYHRGWDHHGGVKKGVANTAKLVDQGTAALLQDLKDRDMLKDTLVIWGGEFGRTPMAQGTGRDHHIKGFSMWIAGGGVRGGTSYGATDELAYNAVENKVHVRDFHATLLHMLGVDHHRLTYKFQGLDFKLTGVEPAHVVHDILS